VDLRHGCPDRLHPPAVPGKTATSKALCLRDEFLNAALVIWRPIRMHRATSFSEHHQVDAGALEFADWGASGWFDTTAHAACRAIPSEQPRLQHGVGQLGRQRPSPPSPPLQIILDRAARGTEPTLDLSRADAILGRPLVSVVFSASSALSLPVSNPLRDGLRGKKCPSCCPNQKRWKAPASGLNEIRTPTVFRGDPNLPP
jgi:hypothetical protein